MRGASGVVDDPSTDESLPVPRAADAPEVLREAAGAAERGARVAMATVIARRGSSPSTPGQKLFLDDAGTCFGTVGGGAVERAVLRALVARLIEADPREATPGVVTTFKLGPELGMCCGGGVDVLIELVPAPWPIVVVGAGHIGSIAGPLLARTGFTVTMVDEREAWAERETEERARLRRVTGEFSFVGRSVPRRGAIVTMTHDHQLDQRVIEWGLREGFAFVGGVGSRAKAARTRARLSAKGFSERDVARVRMPLGVAIGARTPDEIAVSIVAELIAFRRGFPAPEGTS